MTPASTLQRAQRWSDEGLRECMGKVDLCSEFVSDDCMGVTTGTSPAPDHERVSKIRPVGDNLKNSLGLVSFLSLYIFTFPAPCFVRLLTEFAT